MSTAIRTTVVNAVPSLPSLLLKLRRPLPNHELNKNMVQANRELKNRYSQQQLDILLHMHQENMQNAELLKRYNALAKNEGDTRVFILVHGYKGSQFDLRFVRDLIQIEYSAMQKKCCFVFVDYMNVADTRLQTLACNALAEIKRKLVNSF